MFVKALADIESEAQIPHDLRDSGVVLRGLPAPGRAWNVAHVTEVWNGGVGSYVHALIRQQLEDERIGTVHLICSESRTPEALEFDNHPKLRVHRYPSSRKPWLVFRAHRAVKQIIAELGPDLVHLHSTFAGVYGRLSRVGCPVVYCAHGWSFTQDLQPAVATFYGWAEAWLSNRTDALIHISHDEFRAAWQRNVRAPLNRVILHGVRRPVYSRTAPVQVDANAINIAYLGRFDRQKGTSALLEAFRATTRADLKLYMIGDYERESGRIGTVPQQDPRISWLGWVERNEIDDYLSQFDVVVIPSRWEGFGLVATEAMRNSKPVIVSHRGGLPEQVVHGYNGWVFPFEDRAALSDLLQNLDKVTLLEMGRNARAVWARSFTDTRAFGELMDVYAKLIGAGSPPVTSEQGSSFTPLDAAANGS